MTSCSWRPPAISPTLLLLMVLSLFTACTTQVELVQDAKASALNTIEFNDLNSGCFVSPLSDSESKTQGGTIVCPTVDIDR